MSREQKEGQVGKLPARPPWLRLSPRLMQVAAFVPDGSRMADIGTDHGYVPIYLASMGNIKAALAMDVGEGPLKRAAEHIREYEQWAAETGLPSLCPIQTRLSDGLKGLGPGEADAVVMAGMGGELEIRILEEGRPVWEYVKTWILSPHSDLEKVRRYLASNGFFIEDEAMLKDEGKFYTVMKVRRGQEEPYGAVHFRYGKRLMEKKDPVLREYLLKEEKRVLGILEGLENRAERGEGPTENQRRAKAAQEAELRQIKEALYEMQ